MPSARPFFGIVAILLLSLPACSPQLTPFTQQIYQNQNWSDTDLKKIQFYLSEDLVIYRNVETDGNSSITGGQIRIVDGKKQQEIRFKKGTPGVFLFRPKEDHFAVSFEEGDDTRYLMFGPNPKQSGRYMLLASEWNKKTGKVTYSNEKFFTWSEEVPELLVSMKYKKVRTVENRNAGGRRIE